MAARKKKAPGKYFDSSSVRVVAELTTPDGAASGGEYAYELKRLWMDLDDGKPCLVADAGCDSVFICHAEHIPELIKFLGSIVNAKG